MRKLIAVFITVTITFTSWGQNKIETTGDVGIGTLSPTEKLDVRGNAKFTGNIDMGAILKLNAPNYAPYIVFENASSTDYNPAIIYGNVSGDKNEIVLRSYHSTGYKDLIWSNEGKLSVNAGWNPSEALEVNGNIKTNRLYLKAGNGIYSLHNNGYILNDHANGNVTLSAAGGNLYLGYQNTGRLLLRKGLYDTSGNYSLLHQSGYINQTKTGVNNYFASNVGIGTTTPDAPLEIKKEGTVMEIDHTTSGGHSLINFSSVVNNGSDKAFILFQDETSNSPGTANEDVRLTMGVFNDFRANSNHSDELWLQGGGRLVQNVGKWDSELNSIIGTPSVGTTGGYEWRVNNSEKMTLSHDGQLTLKGIFLADEIKVEDIAAANMNLSGDIAANNITVKANGNTADFVFEEDYNLKDLSEVESFIKTNKHLPDIPSANEMEEQGVNLAEMNKLLLQKVEELMLYAIEKDKEVNTLENALLILKSEIESIRKIVLHNKLISETNE